MKNPKTNLILFDGLPGSGKSTTAQWLVKFLRQKQIDAVFLPEALIEHPLWWYQVWDGREYKTPDFIHIPIQAFMQTSLHKWKGFTKQATGRVSIVESFFFQNTVGMFMMGGAEPTSLMEYTLEVQQIIRLMNPILIYFRQIHPASALRRVCSIRGKEFETELVENMESFPYLRQRKLTGLDGVASLWENIQSLTDAIFENSTVRKIAIEISGGDWQFYQRQILDFLALVE